MAGPAFTVRVPLRTAPVPAVADPVGTCKACGVSWLAHPEAECACLRPGIPPGAPDAAALAKIAGMRDAALDSLRERVAAEMRAASRRVTRGESDGSATTGYHDGLTDLLLAVDDEIAKRAGRS